MYGHFAPDVDAIAPLRRRLRQLRAERKALLRAANRISRKAQGRDGRPGCFPSEYEQAKYTACMRGASELGLSILNLELELRDTHDYCDLED